MPYTNVTAVWTGASGLPGYTKIHFLGALTSSEVTTAEDKVRAFFASMSVYLPAIVRVDVQQLAEIFDDNGDKTGTVSGSTVPVQVAGAASGAYSQATGAWVNWVTGQYVYGRPVRGRTFLVPLGSSAFQSDGTLITGFISALQTAANTLLTGFPALVVQYNHHRAGQPTSSGIATVTAATIKDKAGVLRSRRD